MRTSLFLILICAAESAAPAELQMRLYNAASLPSGTLARSIRVAQGVLSEAGIATAWTEGDPEEEQANLVEWGGTNCTAGVQFDQLRVQLTRGTPMSVPITVLGLAQPCSTRGLQVTIFADHVETLTQPPFPSIASALGYAMAHEIGHVLLRSTAHSTSGIMKARWSKSDWQAAVWGRLFFEPDQAAQMARALSESPHVVPPHLGR